MFSRNISRNVIFVEIFHEKKQNPGVLLVGNKWKSKFPPFAASSNTFDNSSKKPLSNLSLKYKTICKSTQ